MAERKTLAIVLMDPPYEDARTVTGMRIIDAALRRGHTVKVFCYEGAVALTFAKQAPHGNSVHGRDTAEEDHPLPKDWVSALMALAERNGAELDWMNCGLCADERGVGEAVAQVRRGGPADLWKGAEASDNTLVIGTR